ncbi:hypothetical protein PENSPDRAFT_750822 [Peniophora sp. CONT]|nr:hypothetical protein PENSPDRAFT_750822 [Peniophora sp. CONT]
MPEILLGPGGPLNDRRIRSCAEKLARNPAGVVKRFRQLQAQATGVAPSESWTSSTHLDDDFHFFIFTMCFGVDLYTDDEDTSKAVLLIHAGLVEAYIDVIVAKYFFNWPVEWRARVFMPLILVLEGARTDPDARERVRSTTTALFEGLWKRRAAVKLADPGVMHKGGVEDDSMFLLRLIDKYYTLYQVSDRVPEFDTYIHHVHLLTWALAREEDEVPSNGVTLNPLLGTSLYAAWGPSLAKMREAETGFDCLSTDAYLEARGRFVKDCILDGMGAERFIDACKTEIQSLLEHSKCDCENHVYDIRMLGQFFIKTDELMPTVFRRDLLGFSLDVLRQLFATEFGVPLCTSLCMFCHTLSYYYNLYSLNHKVKAAAPHQYPDIIDLYVAGVELTAGGCNESISQGNLQAALTDGLREIMDRIQEDYDSKAGEPPEYMSSLKHRAKPLWWPSLHRLKIAVPILQRYESDPSFPIAGVLELWTEFGAFLGLDAEKERKRHEGEAQWRCWWRCCGNRDVKDITGKLLQCAGCGEARYCSKECQRLDWKTGGHKKMCRRLK